MNITTQFTNLVTISSPSGKEEEMSTYLQKWLTNNKFVYKTDSVGNIYAKNNVKGIPLLLCAHMDTVQPGEYIKPQVKNGIIASDGTTILGADNKAAIAAIMYAVENSQEQKPLEILFTVKEETGGGVEFFPFKWIQAKKALIFDSAKPLGGIILSSPHIVNFDIQIMGKAAHSSLPEKGINAFSPAFQMLSLIPVGIQADNESTVNIGLINGGTGINTVPDTIHIQGEVRSYHKKLFNQHVNTIKTILKDSAKKWGVSYTVSLNGYCAGYVHNKHSKFISSISSIVSSSGLSPVFHTKSGISDANVLNVHDIETVNLSDGVQYPHTTNEQISVKDLEKLSEIIKKCIMQL